MLAIITIGRVTTDCWVCRTEPLEGGKFRIQQQQRASSTCSMNCGCDTSTHSTLNYSNHTQCNADPGGGVSFPRSHALRVSDSSQSVRDQSVTRQTSSQSCQHTGVDEQNVVVTFVESETNQFSLTVRTQHMSPASKDGNRFASGGFANNSPDDDMLVTS